MYDRRHVTNVWAGKLWQSWSMYASRCNASKIDEFPWVNGLVIQTWDDQQLTHWDRLTHICFSELTTTGPDNGLSPGRRQAIIWTNAGMLFIGPIGTNFNEILIKIHIFSFKKMHLKMSSAKWRPFCLGLNVLKPTFVVAIVHSSVSQQPQEKCHLPLSPLQ